ncbi:MAG: HEAT repeat domain-containing protein [Planctomycetes bacterium]|nr:HEAT repeat domain-containing protein [Planctomycetota bacterium]MCB9886864.1 HEAT repeat domain-containing protein [Planctomycetota bacterium]
MARSFPQSLLAAAVAVVVGGSVLAQGTSLQEASKALRLGQKEEAVTKLREILSSDPSNADALALYQSISQDEWYMLMTEKGEIQQIAQSILDRAKTERRERSRDEATIAELIGTVTSADSDYGTRQAAVNKLIANHGEFAVPGLVEKLGNKDDEEGQIQAVSALTQIGAAAVLPLIEALKSSNELTVQNAAAALSMIGDARANGYMLSLANDSRAGVSTIAKRYLEKKGIQGDAVATLLDSSRSYLKGTVPPGGFSEVVWTLTDDKLVATDVPALVYPSELAKACAADAVRIAPASLEARSMLAQANLGQANLIEASIAKGDEAVMPLQGVAADLKIAALASGVDSLRAALEAGMKQGMAPVALGAIDALGAAESNETVGQSALLTALDSSDKRIKYAAAQALVRATGGVQVPQADKVVAVLSQAVAEEAVRTIQVIGETVDSKAAVAASSGVRGIAVDASANAVSGMRDLLVNPNVDVVVIHEILPDRQPEDVIGNIKKDPRMSGTRIVVVAKDVEAAQARFGDEVGYVQAPLTGENLIAAVNTALDGVTSAGAQRGEAYAQGASNALLAMAGKKASIDGALASLAAQLNRDDLVAVPAAKALGLAGNQGQLDALVGAMTGAGSNDLKVAAASAIGEVLARVAGCPDNVLEALVGVVGSEGEVSLRTAAAVALGKAKVDGAKKALLQKKLGRIAGAAHEG